MSSGLLEVVKIAAKQAGEAEQPTDLRFGTVTSVKPLKVQISTQLTIPSSLLVVPKHLTDYEVDVEISGLKQKIKVYNALTKNDKVALLRKAGGQQFFILDRI